MRSIDPDHDAAPLTADHPAACVDSIPTTPPRAFDSIPTTPPRAFDSIPPTPPPSNLNRKEVLICIVEK